MIRHAKVSTRLGEVTLVGEGEHLAGVYFEQHWHLPPAESFGSRADSRDELLARAARQITEYLDGQRREFDLPTVTHGDEFQEQVWQRLRELGFGHTTSYGAIAERLGGPSLARGVGQAVGRNPLSLVIPCHRVVGAGGRLVGYAGGLGRKRFLLDLEAPAPATAGRLF